MAGCRDARFARRFSDADGSPTPALNRCLPGQRSPFDSSVDTKVGGHAPNRFGIARYRPGSVSLRGYGTTSGRFPAKRSEARDTARPTHSRKDIWQPVLRHSIHRVAVRRELTYL